MQVSLQLSNIELQMMNEIYQVFSKYAGRTRDFGVNLAHSHFLIEEDEILLETHNKKLRTLSVHPVSKNKVSASAMATSWYFTAEGKINIAMFCCDSTGGDIGGGGSGGGDDTDSF